MRNKASVTARVRVAFAASVFTLAWASVSAADLAGTGRLAAEFQAIADSDLLVLGPVDQVDQSK